MDAGNRRSEAGLLPCMILCISKNDSDRSVHPYLSILYPLLANDSQFLVTDQWNLSKPPFWRNSHTRLKTDSHPHSRVNKIRQTIRSSLFQKYSNSLTCKTALIAFLTWSPSLPGRLSASQFKPSATEWQ